MIERIRFIHIPKTAGMTFSAVLKRQYRGKGHFQFSGDLQDDIPRFNRLPESEKNRIALFTGHVPISSGVELADRAGLITILRDPVARVMSFCQHVSEGKSLYLIEDFPPDAFDLDAFLHSGNEELSNLQTKMLINRQSNASSEMLNAMPEQDALELATSNLFDKLVSFGIHAHFELSLLLFKVELEWTRAPYYDYSRNRRNKRRLIDFDRSQIERIAELNAIDLKLYARAREEFHARLERVSLGMGRRRMFRIGNAGYGAIAWACSHTGPIGLTKRCARKLARLAGS